MSEIRLNAYRIMWLFVFFDLPTNTKTERRHAAQFRKALEKDGFSMMQYSVYVRHCASKENMQVHINRVRRSMPPSGYTSILSVTDKQYGDIKGKSPYAAIELRFIIRALVFNLFENNFISLKKPNKFTSNWRLNSSSSKFSTGEETTQPAP